MTLVWKKNKDVEQIKTVIKGKPPKAFVEKAEKWCPHNNAETVGSKRNINKHLSKPQTKFLIDFLKENNLQQFDIKTLINKLNAYNLTDGSLQRRILSIFVCNGTIKKHMIEFQNKKGDTKIKFVYSVNENPSPCSCLNGKGNCDYDWKTARLTKFFSEGAKE